MIQQYDGRAGYRSSETGPTGDLIVAVLCQLSATRGDETALLDTASQWCVLPPDIAADLGISTESDGNTRLHTRFGTLSGELIRFPVRFPADEGKPAEVEATWFLSPDWPGPLVIGWTGCLERMRFAFDPREGDFYFAEY